MSAQKMKTSIRSLYRPVFLGSLGLSFLMFGLPIYAKILGASALEIGGLYSIFTLTTLLLRPLVGWAIDRFGRKAFLVTGLAGYSLAMGLFAISGSLAGLYLARCVNGMAACLTWIATKTIISDLARASNRAQEMGKINEMESRGEVFGAIAGFFLMSAFTPGVAWEIAFLGYALMAAVGAWLAAKRVPETRPSTPAMASKHSNFSVSGPLAWLMAIVFATALSQALISPIYLIYLQDKFTTDVATLAWAFFPAGIVMGFLPSHLGSLSDRFGRAPFMALGLLGSGILFALLPSLPGIGWLVILYTLSATGWAMSIPAETALVADLTTDAQRGKGYGLYEFMSSLGATFGPLLGGWLYDNAGQPLPFYLTGLILLASAVWTLLVLRRSPATRAAQNQAMD